MKINFSKINFLFKNILDCIIESIYLATIFLIPIWFAYWFPTYNIFDFNKNVLFQILVLLLLMFSLIKLFFYLAYSRLPSFLFFKKYWLIPLVFVLGLTFGIFFSINPLRSFYGDIGRQHGLLSYLYYFLWFILLSFNLWASQNSRIIQRKIRRVLFAILASGTVVSVYAILQVFNIDFLTWPYPPYLTHRAFSSIGQPNFLASWLLMVIPISAYFAIKTKKFFSRSIYFLLLLIQLLALFFTSSRGALLALFFVSFIYLFYLIIYSLNSRKKKILISLVFTVLVTVLLLFMNYFSGGRLQELTKLGYGSLGARMNFYSAAADAIPSYLVFGYGLENSSEAFIKYYRPNWALYGDVSQTTDRAHNIILDSLLTIGLFGSLLLLVLYYYFFDLARNNIMQKKNRPLSLAIALAVAAYLFSLLFSFVIVTTEIYFFLFLAILLVINADQNESGELLQLSIVDYNSLRARLMIFRVVTVILIIIIFGVGILTVDNLIADYYYKKADRALMTADYYSVLEFMDKIDYYEHNPVNQEDYDYSLGEKLGDIYLTTKDAKLKLALNKKLQKLDLRLLINGYHSLLVKADINIVLGRYVLAKNYLQQLVVLTPHWPLAYLSLGKLNFLMRDYKAALVAYHLVELNLPNSNDSRLNNEHRTGILNYKYFVNKQIANIYLSQKDYALAEKYYQIAYSNNINDFSLLKKIADTYYLRGDIQTAIKYNLRGLNRSLKDYHWPLALAALYHQLSDKKQALFYLHLARKLAPSNTKLKALEKKY